jgi:branched-chain amino acid transport system permease protein
VIRDNETRATFIGLPVRRYRWFAFVVSAAFVGLAGTATALLRTLRSAHQELDSHGKE